MASTTSAQHYDAVIIGSGQGGTPLAGAFAKAGYKTALVESIHIGGCCINEGCTPTKTMIASGRVAYLARRGQDYGVHTSSSSSSEGGKHTNEIKVDMEKVRQRKRDIVDSFRGGSEKRTKDGGIDVIIGEGSFVDAKTLAVKDKTITSDRYFISVGERPVKPHLKGLGDIPADFVLDSTSVQELGVVPSHLVVIGGGVVGLEFGQLFRRLGAQVTILQRGGQLLPREDAEVAKAMVDILTEDGITVHLKASSTEITRSTSSSSGTFTLTVDTAGHGKTEIVGSHILFAAGRVPNTETLNLSSTGVKTNSRGYIEVNERLETGVPGIWAMGDVKGPPAFTHISYDDYRILRANVLDKLDAKGDSAQQEQQQGLTTTDRLVPYVVYTDPQLGHVGLHEAEARKLFPDEPKRIQTASMPMAYVARALENEETRGLMKAVVDGQTGRILGFTCLGLEGGEIMSIVQMAIIGGVRWEKLRDAVWAHPALAESLNNLWGYLE